MKKWLYKHPENRKRLSIIVPTFENSGYLVDCLQSILDACNGIDDYEILLGIDNCYGTVYFLDQNLVFSNRRIKILFFPKSVGPYIIRNSLAKIAKYDNILFFDSDDVLMKHGINILMSKFSNKHILKYRFYNFNHGDDYTDVEKLSLSPMVSHGSFLIKKEKFMEMNGFFGWKCGADTEFDDRCDGIQQRVYKLDIPIFYRRYHGKNTTIRPETGIHSSIRKKYGEFIMNRRIDGKWPNPSVLEVSNYNLIML